MDGPTTTALTEDVRVLHLDQVVIQISRGGGFYVVMRVAADGRPTLCQLEVGLDRSGRYAILASGERGACNARARIADGANVEPK